MDPSLEAQADWEDLYSASSEGLASLLLTDGEEPVAYGDALQEALPGSVEARLIEMSSAREARLSAETDRLQSELTHSAERQRSEREVEGRFLREQAARTEGELRAALGKEKHLRSLREAELSSALEALAADHRRLKAVNVLLEQEAAAARSRLTAFASASTAETRELAGQNEELGKRLADLVERLQKIDRAHHDKVAELEAEAQRRLSELRLQEDLVRRSHETAAAEAKRAEDAEHALAAAEDEAARRLEPRLRADNAERVKEAVEAARGEVQRQAEERLTRLREEHAAAYQKAGDEAVGHAAAELQQSHQRELREAVRQGRTAAEASLRQEANAAVAQVRRDVEAAKDREIYALREKLLQEKVAIHEQAAHLRVETERRLQEEALHRLAAAQDEWRRQADGEAAALRGRLGVEREQVLADLRAQKDAELAAVRVQAEKDKERAETEAYKKARREAEIELAARVDKMGGEWRQLKTRFEEELSKIREEMKRREREWEDRAASAEREVIRVKEEARNSLIRIENELLAAAEEKSRLAGEKMGLEEAVREAAKEASAASTRTEGERQAAADQAKTANEDHARALADLRKDLEGKLKAMDGQLREERKKTVELLARIQEKERPPLWRRLGG